MLFLTQILQAGVYSITYTGNDEKGKRYKMKSEGKKKTVLQALLLAAGAAMIVFGIYRGEAETVLGKAVRICLECVGIG